MMQIWDAAAVAFMRDAITYCRYADRLAEILRKHLPTDGHICDAGCGIGALSVALARSCREVTAVDISQTAIDTLRQTSSEENLHAVCADIFTMQPKTPYDAMVFCYFGRTDEILRIAKRQCNGSVLLVKRDCAAHRFSVGHVEQPLHRRETTRELLLAEQIPFSSECLSLELGQPFRSIDEALAFFRLYNTSELPVTEASLLPRLQKTQDTEFPYYLPELRQMELFVFQTEDIPPNYAL